MTDKYAVIGNPIAHSKSPQIHKMFAGQTRQDIGYEAILAPLNGFVAAVERLHKEGYKGCNVTVPFKFEAFEIAKHNLTERAQGAQAVNTLRFDGSTILGDNTDGAGLVCDIQTNLNFSLQDRRVLLMGAGGAAYGVAWPLFNTGATLTVVNRTVDKATQMVKALLDVRAKVVLRRYEELGSGEFDVVINATSTGLSDEMPPIAPGVFAPGALAYDMMYGRETPFMKFARKHGAAVVSDGLGMLVEQAAESFFVWRGVRPDTAPVIVALRKQQ